MSTGAGRIGVVSCGLLRAVATFAGAGRIGVVPPTMHASLTPIQGSAGTPHAASHSILGRFAGNGAVVDR